MRDLAKQFIRCEIGDGKRASFWFDQWSDFGPLIDYMGIDGPRVMGIPIQSTVSTILNQDGWNFPKRATRSDSVRNIKTTLLSKRPPNQQKKDLYLWGLGAKDSTRFSSAKTWDSIRPSGNKVTWMGMVWFKNAIPKHSFHFWTTLLNRLRSSKDFYLGGLIQTQITAYVGLNWKQETMFFLTVNSSWKSDTEPYRLHDTQQRFDDWNSLLIWVSTHSLSTPSNSRNMWSILSSSIYGKKGMQDYTITSHSRWRPFSPELIATSKTPYLREEALKDVNSFPFGFQDHKS